MSSYYKHSGKFSFFGIILLILSALLGSAIAGLLYSLITHYMPFIYINFLITIGYGFVLGICVMTAGKMGKVRNTQLTFLAGTLTGILGVYATWVVSIWIYSDYEFLTFNPASILEIMGNMAEVGLWSIYSFTPTGFFLYLIWLIEAGIIIFFTVGGSIGYVTDTPFCEACNKWADYTQAIEPLSPIADPEGFKARIDRDDFSELLALSPTEDTSLYTRLEFTGLAEYPNFRLLSVKEIKKEYDDDGEEKLVDDYIVKHLISTDEVNDSLITLLQQPNPEMSEEDQIPVSKE